MDSEDLIKIIDDRIGIYFQKKSKNQVSKHSAIITAKNGSKFNAKLSGFDTEYTFINKTGTTLAIGDNVYIEAVDGNLTNGFISEKFGL